MILDILLSIFKIILSVKGYDFMLIIKHEHQWTEWVEFAGIRFRYCSMCGKMQRDLYYIKCFPVSEAYHRIIRDCFEKEHKIPRGWDKL